MLSYYFYSYLALSTIPLFIIFTFATQIQSNLFVAMAGILFTIVVFIAGIQYITITYPAAAAIFNLTTGVMITLILIVALAIGYNIFADSLKKMDGALGFIANLIFYIPCLFNDFVVYLFNQYKITPNIVFILIVFEILLILIAIYIPRILKKFNITNGVSILESPRFLNVETKLDVGLVANAIHASSTAPPNAVSLLTTGLTSYSNNFAISMWIYLNTMPVTSTEIRIFEYSQAATPVSYFPKITYKDGKYCIYNGTVADMSFSLINQTWNYFVFNHYADNTVDVFINGNLERSSTNVYAGNSARLENNALVDMIPATMTAGQTRGLYGAICNIMYYIKPLTEREIITTYNLLMHTNPPLNS